MDLATSTFADSARAFCKWAEGEPGSPEAEAHAARLHLARLYSQALELSDAATWDGDAPLISHGIWQDMFKRFGALPVNYYGECLYPLEVDSCETGFADLADDLADVWRDLKPGLDVFDSGQIEGAVFE